MEYTDYWYDWWEANQKTTPVLEVNPYFTVQKGDTTKRELEVINSWEQQYQEVKAEYLNAIPLAMEPKACHDFNHGIVKDMPKMEYPA